MSQAGAAPRMAIARQNTPRLVRFMGKFVLEVLPAALASVMGGLLLAHYQLGHPSAAAPAVESSAPASAEMVRLVQEEHALIRDFLLAQSAAEKRRLAVDDAADAGAAEDAGLAAAALRRTAMVPAKPALLAPRAKASVVAATAEAAPQGPLVIAQPVEVTAPPASPYAPPALVAPPPPPPPPPVASDHPSLVGTTLAIPGHVVGAALHAVSVIGGIPSWIGNHLGSTPS